MNTETTLQIHQLFELTSKLYGLVDGDEFLTGEPMPFNVRIEAEAGFERELDGAKANGIYIYSTLQDEVLYIGKGEYSSGDGIGHRSFAHLGRSNIELLDELFPNHQWSNDEYVSEATKTAIREGKIKIWTLPVEPNYLISLVEVYLLSMHRHLTGKLPELNKKI